jgi:hypothetical protein
LVEFAGNNIVSEIISILLFFINYGFNPRIGIEPVKPYLLNVSDQQQ